VKRAPPFPMPTDTPSYSKHDEASPETMIGDRTEAAKRRCQEAWSRLSRSDGRRSRGSDSRNRRHLGAPTPGAVPFTPRRLRLRLQQRVAFGEGGGGVPGVHERSHLPALGGFVWGRMLANFTPGHQDTYTSTSTTTGVHEEGRGPDKAPTPTGRPRRRHAAGARYTAPYYTALLELYTT
jgi:hypothetical protein